MSSPIEIARNRVAERITQPYNKRAVLTGQWDTGSLVQDELKRVLEEQETLDAKAA